MLLPDRVQLVLVRETGKTQGVTKDGIGEVGHFFTLYP
jgi:hypothetical protein